MNNLRIHTTAAAVAIAVGGLLGAGGAAAQDVVPLDDWNETLDGFEDTWSAEQMIGLDVRNAEGEDIGEIENIMMGPDNNVAGVILEVGGFVDIGDTHLMVPWDQIDITGDVGEIEYVSVPVSDDNWDQFSLEPSTGDIEAGPRQYRATEVIGDYTQLGDTTGYGVIDDLIFDADGKLESAVVNQSGAYGGGYRAYPFYGYDYGFDPGVDYYDLPYSESDIGTLDTFDYDGMYGTS